MTTLRGIALAMVAAFEREELRKLADRLLDGAADLEIRADEAPEYKRKILARRADVLGALARAIEAELERTEAKQP